MKAITIWQPWASLLAIGAKQYETRNWETKYRGPIAIHAAKKDPCKIPLLGLQKFEEATKEELEKAGLSWCLLPTGKIIATAELVNCWLIGAELDIPTEQEMLFGDWTPGRYAWELANIQLLPVPIPAKGAQRLWNWDVETRQATEIVMPCPFCGQTPERTVRVGDGGIGYYATVACFCGGCVAEAHQYGKGSTIENAQEKALTAWNLWAGISEFGKHQKEKLHEDMLY
jgi:Lar family restriction alleviation protein